MNLSKFELLIINLVHDRRPDLGTYEYLVSTPLKGGGTGYTFRFKKGEVLYKTGWQSLIVDLPPYALYFDDLKDVLNEFPTETVA